MKWAFSIKNKLTASITLLLLCLLVLFSNYIDRDHTEKVKKAISTLYEDRLIAEGYILKMTSGFYQIKEVLNADTNETAKVSSINKLLLNINELNNAYQKTQFTDLERSKADELLLILRGFESTDLNNTSFKLQSADKALELLNELSTIQLEVSKQIIGNAEVLYLSGKTSSQFVFAIIIIILLVLQALVFASETLNRNDDKKISHLN